MIRFSIERQEAVGDVLPARHARRRAPRPAAAAASRARGRPRREDRLDHARDQLRLVLAVGMEHHDDVGVVLERLEVARLLVAAVADLVRVPDEVERQLAGEPDRLVGGGVVDKDDLVDRVLRDRGERPLERRGGLAGRHHDDDFGWIVSHGAPRRRRCRRAAARTRPPRRRPRPGAARRGGDRGRAARRAPTGASRALAAAQRLVEVAGRRGACRRARRASRSRSGRRARARPARPRSPRARARR